MPTIRSLTPVAVGVLLAFASSVSAQFPNNTWSGAVSANWTNAGNWSSNNPPALTETAYFNGTGNNNTSISLGGATQTPGALQFDAGASSYTIGTTAGDTLSFAVDNNPAGTGVISVTAGATNPQQVNANLVFASAAPLISNASTTSGTNLTLGASGGTGTISLASNSNLTLTPATGTSIVVNDSITASASLTVLNTANAGTTTFNGALNLSGGTITVQTAGGTTNFNGVISGTTNVLNTANIAGGSGAATISFMNQNTYSGTTTFTQTSNQTTVRIGVSSVLSGSTLVSGPFGTGTLIVSSSLPAILTPVGADQTIANPVTFTNGFWAGNATGDLHNLTFSGNLSMNGASRVSTSIMQPGFITYLGSAASPATFALTTFRMTFQTQTQSNGGGVIVINDSVTSTSTGGGLTAQNGAVLILNGNNSYTGTTLTTGTGFGRTYINGTNTGTGNITANGSGAVGTGGTIGGGGTVAGAITISTTTSTTQGGFLAPGAGFAAPSNGIGTLTSTSSATTALTLNPLATYNFDHQPDATKFTGAAGAPNPGTDNDTVSVTAGRLNLVNLSTTALGTFNLIPNFTSTGFSPGVIDYQAVSFGNIALPSGFTGTAVTLANGQSATNITPLFSVNGQFSSATSPLVAYTGTGTAGVLYLEFTPVPEPGCVLATCGGLTALVAWRRKRRGQMNSATAGAA
jgi:hypothetical protein